jgi:hypothetical protein
VTPPEIVPADLREPRGLEYHLPAELAADLEPAPGGT